MKPLFHRPFKLSFALLVMGGLLGLLLLASFGADWGTAYGQTAGRGPTPTSAPAISDPGAVSGGTYVNITPVVPGLPRTGSPPLQVKSNLFDSWQVALLPGLFLTGFIALLVLSCRKARILSSFFNRQS